jgi:Fic family protein
LPEWPKLTFDAQKLQAHLAKARHAQGLLLGKALTTSAIEGEKLDAQSVRSSIARRLGLDFDGVSSAEGKRHFEGLIDVLQDATLNTQNPIDC